MSKHVLSWVLCLATASLSLVGCEQKAQPVLNNTPSEAPQNVQSASAVPTGTQPTPVVDNRPLAPTPSEVLPPPNPRRVQIPAKAQTAIDNLLSVLSDIAAAAKKDSCQEILSSLKAMDNEDVRAKLLSTNILKTYPEDVQIAINEANQSRLLAIAFEMVSFQKCDTSPEKDAIDAALKSILMVVTENAPASQDAQVAPVAAEVQVPTTEIPAPQVAPANAQVAPVAAEVQVPTTEIPAPQVAPADAQVAPVAADVQVPTAEIPAPQVAPADAQVAPMQP